MEGPAFAAYVLAGGRSSRMGQDKAMLMLGGMPMVEHMVRKLHRLTGEVRILGSGLGLDAFAPVVPDLRESCGPLGGMEAALAHTTHDWNLILPVDMPFLPTALLRHWSRGVLARSSVRLALFVVDGIPQPTICFIHREMALFLRTAAEQGRFKLYPVLEEAAGVLAHRQGVRFDEVLVRSVWDQASSGEVFADSMGESGDEGVTEGQRSASHLWFANLNTPEEFAEAQLHLDALER